MKFDQTLRHAGLDEALLNGGALQVDSPIDGRIIARLAVHSATETAEIIAKSKVTFADWKRVPAPRRGELVRLIGEELRAEKENPGRLVTLEYGKTLQEGLGEVQEMIDICDLAVGISRQLFGLTDRARAPGV